MGLELVIYMYHKVKQTGIFALYMYHKVKQNVGEDSMMHLGYMHLYTWETLEMTRSHRRKAKVVFDTLHKMTTERGELLVPGSVYYKHMIHMIWYIYIWQVCDRKIIYKNHDLEGLNKLWNARICVNDLTGYLQILVSNKVSWWCKH